MKLGVNIDHVATLRQARRTYEPEPVTAAGIAELAGADGITIHLREDRRHIQERDVEILRQTIQTKLNLEMATVQGIVQIAQHILPDQATLVPEKREEVTTEGGLDVLRERDRVRDVTKMLHDKAIVVSLFIDPVNEQIEVAKEVGADFIEIHTGEYANAREEKVVQHQLSRIQEAVKFAQSLGLRVNAGHGLTYNNVQPIVEISAIHELNIGHSIISRAVFVGLERAVREMKQLME